MLLKSGSDFHMQRRTVHLLESKKSGEKVEKMDIESDIVKVKLTL